MPDDEDRTEQDLATEDRGEDTGADQGGDERAQAEAQEVEKAKQEMQQLEEGDPPDRLEDWPTGKAKYLTYGGPEGSAGYDEGATSKLGPSSLEHHDDGSVTIEGEPVDDPERYKADEPIPGAPQRGDDQDGEQVEPGT
jgi:hypothetical protein